MQQSLTFILLTILILLYLVKGFTETPEDEKVTFNEPDTPTGEPPENINPQYFSSGPIWNMTSDQIYTYLYEMPPNRYDQLLNQRSLARAIQRRYQLQDVDIKISSDAQDVAFRQDTFQC